MIKLFLTLIMMFTFGTSTVNAEENTTSIEDRISKLAEANSDSQSAIKDKVDELSWAKLETIIENVNELTEPTEEDLAIKEAAISKLKEEKLSPINLGIVAIVLGLLFSSLDMLTKRYSDESKFMLGILLIVIMILLAI